MLKITTTQKRVVVFIYILILNKQVYYFIRNSPNRDKQGIYAVSLC